MLEPDSRAALTEQLRPPAGFTLSHAVGTTFTLDLTSALSVPLSFAGHRMRETDDPLTILDAVRRAAENIDIFSQAGQTAVPSKASALVAFLEPMLHPVVARRPGHLFHPKVWVLEYSRDDERAYRLLCASRNLTGDRSWDLLVRLDGESGPTRDTRNEPITAFLLSLPRSSVHSMSVERAARVEALADRISSVIWEYPEGIREIAFHALGVGAPENLDFGGKRHLVISPFITDDGIARVTTRHRERPTIVSRADSLDRLQPTTIASIDAYVLNTALDLDDDDSKLPDDATPSPSREDRLVGLHAKAYFLDRIDGSRAFLGSANATGPAFGGNVEFLVELVGAVAGVRRVLGNESSSTDGLLSILEPYPGSGGVEAGPAEDADRRLEEACRTIAGVRFRNTVSHQDEDFAIETRPIDAVPGLAGFDVELALLTRPGQARSLRREGESIRFGTLALTDITPFLIARVRDTRGEERSTVMQAELVGDIAERRDAILAAQIDSPEKFLQLLHLLLSLGGPTSSTLSLALGGGDGDWALGSAGVFETLVKALANNGQGLHDLARVIDRMRERAGSALPEGFDEVWQPIWGAHLTVEGSHHE